MNSLRKSVHLHALALVALAGTAAAVPPTIYSTVAVSNQNAPGLAGITMARVNG